MLDRLIISIALYLSQENQKGTKICQEIRDIKSIAQVYKETKEIQYDVDRIPGIFVPMAVGDYWQTPEETRVRRIGDCEDLAHYFEDELNKRGIKNHEVKYGKNFKKDIGHHAWNEIERLGCRIIIDNGTIEENRNWYLRSPLGIFYVDRVNKKLQVKYLSNDYYTVGVTDNSVRKTIIAYQNQIKNKKR